jgi:hypothetical protein
VTHTFNFSEQLRKKRVICTIDYDQTNFRRSISHFTENTFKSLAPTVHRQAPILCLFFLFTEICGNKLKYYPIGIFCSLIFMTQILVVLHRMALYVGLNVHSITWFSVKEIWFSLVLWVLTKIYLPNQLLSSKTTMALRWLLRSIARICKSNT